MSGGDDHNDVLSKADEFLKRRRMQLASAVIDRTEPVPVVDDIPVLTEVVAADEVSTKPDISQDLDAWLDEHLAQAVAQAMDGITDKLIVQIQQSAEKELLPRLRRALGGRDDQGED